jgi:hypothetical protein
MSHPTNWLATTHSAIVAKHFSFLTHPARQIVLDRMNGALTNVRDACFCAGVVLIRYNAGSIREESIDLLTPAERAGLTAEG